ncbi:MAG: hypothetical protein M1832_002419 [Thelocarpon impressellum]|nr:MAG: hypothetical protein M1832_002419 [Thelocarpon impressellum]
MRFALNDREMLEWFLSKGASPDAACDQDITVLTHACIWGTMDTVKFLLAHGGSVKHGHLLHATASRRLPDRTELLSFLLDQGMDVNAIKYEDQPEIYWAEYWQGLGTVLHYVARAGDVKAIRLLLSRGADPRIRDSSVGGSLAVDWAKRALHAMRNPMTGGMYPSKAAMDSVPLYQRVVRGEAAKPSETDYEEIIRLLQPGWWSTLSPIAPRQFTEGKRWTG